MTIYSHVRSPSKDLYSGSHPRSPTKYHPHPDDRQHPYPPAQNYAKRPLIDPRPHYSQPPLFDGGQPGRHYEAYLPVSQPPYDSSGQPDYKRARHGLDMPDADSFARHEPIYAQHHHALPPSSDQHPVRHDQQQHALPPHEHHAHSTQSSASMKSQASGPSPGINKRGSPATAALPHSSQHAQNKSQKAPKRVTTSDIEEGEIASDDDAASDEALDGSGGRHQTQASTVQKPSSASPAASHSAHPPPDAHQLAPHSGHRSRTSSRNFNSSNENTADGSFASNAASSAVNNYSGDIVHRAAAALRAHEESEEGELASDEDESGVGAAKPAVATSVKSAISPRKPPDSSAAPPRPNIGREWDAPSITRLADVRSQPQQTRYPSVIPPPHTP